MKRLILVLLLTLGINHVANLAEVQAVDAQPSFSARLERANRLAKENQRTAVDSERRAGPTEYPAGHYEANRAYKAATDSASAGTTTTPKTQVDGGWLPRGVDNCPCGPDCKCPDETVCKNGDCKKNYVVFFTAKWCGPCKQLYPLIEELRKAGYIVYVLDVDQYPEAATKFKVDKLPTTVVMNDGKEAHRFIGIVEKKTITDVTKTKDEQTKPFDYDFR